MTEKTVDAEVVREHVNYLRENGMTYKSISNASGVPLRTVEVLCQGYKNPRSQKHEYAKTMRAWNAKALLNVRLIIDPTQVGYIPAIGTQRRIKALMTLGWSASRQARMLKMDPRDYARLMTYDKVSSSTYIKVKTLYDKLWKTEAPPGRRGSVTNAKRYAALHNYVPPLGWDNIDTDPTPARSLQDEVNDMLETVGFRETVRYLVHKGKGPTEISRLTGKSQTSVARSRDTMEHYDSKHTTAA